MAGEIEWWKALSLSLETHNHTTGKRYQLNISYNEEITGENTLTHVMRLHAIRYALLVINILKPQGKNIDIYSRWVSRVNEWFS